jgi:hypothetical protein
MRALFLRIKKPAVLSAGFSSLDKTKIIIEAERLYD